MNRMTHTIEWTKFKEKNKQIDFIFGRTMNFRREKMTFQIERYIDTIEN